MWASRFKISPNVATTPLALKRELIKYENRSAINETTALSSCYRDLYVTGPAGNISGEREREREKSSLSARLSYDRFARDDPTSLTREQILRTLSTQRLSSGPRPGARVSGSGATVHVCMSRVRYTRARACNAHTHTHTHMHSRRADTGSHVRTNKEDRPTSRPSVRPSARRSAKDSGAINSSSLARDRWTFDGEERRRKHCR